MELRSTRSRSKTPFEIVENFTVGHEESGKVVEKSTTVTRSTRKVITTRTNSDNATSSTEEFTSSYIPKSTRKSTRVSRNVFKTSDYSSEDGENEVSSSKTISENEKNQIKEDALSASNGNADVSALDLYMKAGRYWEKYPKTDWTYSHHSKDRVEIAPGVVAMPNMSRRTIHSDSSFSDYSSHKSTNTDSYSYAKNYQTEKIRPTKLFNNNFEDSYTEKIYTRTTTTWTKMKTSFWSMLMTVVTTVYYVASLQTKWMATLHRMCSRVMLMDNWLLKKRGKGDKYMGLILLCLLPLLFLTGWWLLSSMGSFLGNYFEKTEPNLVKDDIYIEPRTFENLDIGQNEARKNQEVTEKIVKITEKIYLEPPNAEEIAQKLTKEQLEIIASLMKNNERINENEIIEKILHSATFVNIINNINNNIEKSDKENVLYSKYIDENNNMLNLHQKIIEGLKEEINKIKLEVLEKENQRNQNLNDIILKFKNENIENVEKLTLQLNQCCQKSILNLEDHIKEIIANLFNNKEFLSNQDGFNDYLKGIFIAKNDLELELNRLTKNLTSNFDSLVQNNGKMILEEVSKRVSNEIKSKIDINRVEKREINGDFDVSDDKIRRIVKQTLEVYDADKTGLVDYAMEPMGGQILNTRCTEMYHSGKAVVSVLGIPLWYPTNTPRTVITPGINPGECWAFENFPGFLVIKLSSKIKVEAFSMEHISKLLVPNGRIDSAPKKFEIYGLVSEKDKNPVKLGEYTYDIESEPLQFFTVQKEDQIFEMIEIRIISNHGNPNYTCLYRFRVHGKLDSDFR